MRVNYRLINCIESFWYILYDVVINSKNCVTFNNFNCAAMYDIFG